MEIYSVEQFYKIYKNRLTKREVIAKENVETNRQGISQPAGQSLISLIRTTASRIRYHNVIKIEEDSSNCKSCDVSNIAKR